MGWVAANLILGKGQHCNGLESGGVESFLSLHAMDIRIFMLWPDGLLCLDADFITFSVVYSLPVCLEVFFFQMFWLVLKPSSCLVVVAHFTTLF